MVFRATLVLALLASFGCGSGALQPDARSGDSGAAGRGGTGQAGTGGGAGGQGGFGGAGRAGIDGGTGGATDASSDEATDVPVSACQQVGTVDRSCTVDADCLAVTHTTNCCGSANWIGIRSSEKQRFASLESACDRTYPACGCASGSPQTDDGSIVSFGGMAGVSCQAGTCKTFSKACGHPCDPGRSCATCMGQDASAMSFCTLQCTKDAMCTEPNRTQCHFIFATGICVESVAACNSF